MVFVINDKQYTKFTSVGKQNILNNIPPAASLNGGKRLPLTLNNLCHI